MPEIIGFTSYICRLYAFLCKKLLSHAEGAKDVVKDVFWGDFAAGDFAKVM
jgi:hypothetical protein